MQSPDTERIHLDAGSWSVQCPQCKRWFEARRSDATFCCANCRVAYSREPQKLLNTLEHLRALGISVYGIADKYRYNQQVFEAMQELAKQVNAALSTFEID